MIRKLLGDWVSARSMRESGILGMNRRNVEYIARYNARERYPLVDNKLLTKKIVEKANIAAPDLLHTVQAQFQIEAIADVLKDLNEFVIKPANGSGGKGILVITGRDEDDFIKSSGTRIGLTDVKRHLTNIVSGLHSLGGRTDEAIIETLVHVDPGFTQYSYEGVPDIRLIVFKGYPVMGMLRLATRASDGKANLHQGAVGVGLDITTGKAIAAVQNNHAITHHPDTEAALKDIAVRNWQQLLTLASRCYDVTQLGYLGCDIVIDEQRGPLILELNARPGLSIQIANGCGLLHRLRMIEAMDELPVGVEERVEYAVTHFGHQMHATQDELFEDETVTAEHPVAAEA